MKSYLTVRFEGYNEKADRFVFKDIHTLKEHHLLNREACAFLDSDDIVDILSQKNRAKPKPTYILGLWCSANRFYASEINSNLHGLIYRCFKGKGTLTENDMSDIKTIMHDVNLGMNAFQYKNNADLCKILCEYPLFVNEAKKIQKNFYILKHGLTDIEYYNKIYFSLKYIPKSVKYKGIDYQVQERLWYSLIFEKHRNYD